VASASASAGRPEAGEPDLKHGAIGFFDALIIEFGGGGYFDSEGPRKVSELAE